MSYPRTHLAAGPVAYPARAERLVVCLLVLALSGCAGLRHGPWPLPEDDGEACLTLFQQSDAAIRQAGLEDAGATRIPAFPWLRSDRLLASFRDEVDTPERFGAWTAELAALDREARSFELRNLDAAGRWHLEQQWQPLARRHQLPEGLDAAFSDCRDRLNARLQRDSDSMQALRAAAVVPDAYYTWPRVLGLYPLTSRIARRQVVALHERLTERYQREAVAEPRYFATSAAAAHTSPQGAALVSGIARDVLGVPRPDARTREDLFAAYAPVWAIETRSEADHPGALVLAADQRPVTDRENPVEYRWLSWTRFGDQVLLQLNYLLWFPERPAQRWLDITAGQLDGVIWRTTLDGNGGVLAHDSIHACGCYYTLFPGEGWRAARRSRHEEPLFAPDAAPVPQSGERLVVLLESGTRYFIDVFVSDRPLPVQDLDWRPVSELRSLPQSQGGYASVYDSRGLIPASRRLERFILWPLGVPSAGTMRQPGTHAIAFIGRGHFDDPWLLQDLLKRSAPK